MRTPDSFHGSGVEVRSMLMSEPEDKASSEWKSWALMQVGPSGHPLYALRGGEIVEYAPIEMQILLSRYFRP
jgi:hypothetical protein